VQRRLGATNNKNNKQQQQTTDNKQQTSQVAPISGDGLVAARHGLHSMQAFAAASAPGKCDEQKEAFLDAYNLYRAEIKTSTPYFAGKVSGKW